MKIFVITYQHNYGMSTEIVIAESKEEAMGMISANARGWGYTINEVPLIKGNYSFE